MWYAPQAACLAQRQASEQFHRLHQQARVRQLWSALSGRRHGLLSLREVQKNHPLQVRSHAGLQGAPIAQICGSEGRCTDFDADFRPLQAHTQQRWISVAVARHLDVALPAVDLVQVNDRYFVRDGHHRISVAKMMGQLEIEAEVAVWHSVSQNKKERTMSMTEVRLFELGCKGARLDEINAEELLNRRAAAQARAQARRQYWQRLINQLVAWVARRQPATGAPASRAVN